MMMNAYWLLVLEVGFLVCNLYSTGRHKPQERTPDLRSFSIHLNQKLGFSRAAQSKRPSRAKLATKVTPTERLLNMAKADDADIELIP